ncbi:MAG: ATP-binding cassette domain-containing protein [Deltaproteobacteria bacterium]|nr:ATP-binding cassette domain-containing protein [Deltaproteobacteria bacterium]
MSKLTITSLIYRHLGPFDLTIEAGETVSLSGSSGAGKSLLLRALADIDPHDGEVCLNGQSCQSFPAPEWRRQVALLPAESQWWHDTVGEHFQGSLAPEIWASLGFEGQVKSWSITRLSSGEKQRLAILRLLQNNPKVLLLDEPTANLDPENSQRVENLFLNYQREQGAAILWITHSVEQGRRLGRRHYQLENGRLELLSQPRLFASAS